MKIIFGIATLYFLYHGILAWINLFSNNWISLNAHSNTASVALAVMAISFIATLRKQT
jgi:hypothetical protein